MNQNWSLAQMFKSVENIIQQVVAFLEVFFMCQIIVGDASFILPGYESVSAQEEIITFLVFLVSMTFATKNSSEVLLGTKSCKFLEIVAGCLFTQWVLTSKVCSTLSVLTQEARESRGDGCPH